MRVPLRAMLVIALLAGQAHAQSSEAPSSQGTQPVGAVVDQSRDHPSGAGSTDGGVAGIGGATGGEESSPRANSAQGTLWIEVLDRSLATAGRQLDEIGALLGQWDWVPPLLTLFNGLLALFAYRLWRSTSNLVGVAGEQSRDLKEMIAVARDAADAAKRSADAVALQCRATVGAELPRFELGHVHLAYSDQSVRQALKAPSIDLRFTNYGRTAALVLERCVEVRLGQTLPPDPTYDCVEALAVVEAVDSGKSVGLEAHRRLGDLTESQVHGLQSGLNKMWVYGFVRFRDFLGIEHKTGFCLRWTPPRGEASTGGSFVQEEPGAYIYQIDDWPLARVENEPSPAARSHSELRLAAAAE
ncbi:MAG TPA: hypothetical protein VMA53_13900 [Stellaceae bacterium]|nr:hypothetical protein [Stellaceae bacterium]